MTRGGEGEEGMSRSLALFSADALFTAEGRNLAPSMHARSGPPSKPQSQPHRKPQSQPHGGASSTSSSSQAAATNPFENEPVAKPSAIAHPLAIVEPSAVEATAAADAAVETNPFDAGEDDDRMLSQMERAEQLAAKLMQEIEDL